MKYDVISADCHIDLIWLPPISSTSNASAAMKERMPYVTDGERGREWVTKSGATSLLPFTLVVRPDNP